ncbi:MAG: PEGA domain-containing protein [Kiritimatiellia bacterium]
MKILAVTLCLIITGCGTFKTVESYPPGADVLIDGKPTGKRTPAALRVRHLEKGTHSISVTKKGYETVTPAQEVEVTLAAGRVIGSVLFVVPTLFELTGDLWKDCLPGDLKPFYLKLHSMNVDTVSGKSGRKTD